MQHLHRVTLWRRAKKKQAGPVVRRRGKSGRKPIGRRPSRRDVNACAEAADKLMLTRGVNAEFTLEMVKSFSVRPNLFALAVWDVIGHEGRTRKIGAYFGELSPDSKEFKKGVRAAVIKLSGRYNKTDDELAILIDDAARTGAEWLPVALGVDRQARASGSATSSECPAKMLGTSRQMVSYWRHHAEFTEALSFVRDLIRFARENEIKR